MQFYIPANVGTFSLLLILFYPHFHPTMECSVDGATHDMQVYVFQVLWHIYVTSIARITKKDVGCVMVLIQVLLITYYIITSYQYIYIYIY